MDAFSYFGLQDPRTIAAEIMSGDPADIERRATLCRRDASICTVAETELYKLSAGLVGHWSGDAAASATAAIADLARARAEQAAQLTTSGESFSRVADALTAAQTQTSAIQARADAVDVALDAAINGVAQGVEIAVPGLGAGNWLVKKVTGVDVVGDVTHALEAAIEPVKAAAVDLLVAMFDVIQAYAQVLQTESGVLAGLRGVVRKDAGPQDDAGDADLRRGALFRAVYGYAPTTPNELLMARALDPQGTDASNTDPNADLTVLHITPVKGGGVIQGSAFISSKDVTNVRMPGSGDPVGGLESDLGDDRGFQPNADPGASRVSFFVDYERGIVVVRQNPSHSEDGTAKVGVPTVGVEQDATGRVRLRTEATDPLAPEVGRMAHVSVREDVVIDPRSGTADATVDGEVTRFPSWEMYQHHDDGRTTTMLQRHENDEPFGTGPMLGLPQPTVAVGKNPGVLPGWLAERHPDQHAAPLHELPGTRGDRFFGYDLPSQGHPAVDGQGHVLVPSAGRAR